MKILKRVSSGALAVVLTLSTLMSLGINGVASAATQNCTWSGASDLKFSTAANWTNCGGGVPQAGDNLVFDITSLSSDVTLNNDITGLSIGSITFQGTNNNQSGYYLSGNSATLTGGITLSTAGSNSFNYISMPLIISGNQTFAFGQSYVGLGISVLSGSGNIATTGNGNLVVDSGPSYTGTITPGSSSILDLESDTATFNLGGSVDVDNGAVLSLDNEANSDVSFAVALTLGGNGTAQASANNHNGAINLTGYTNHTSTLTSPVTLTSDIQVVGDGTLSVTGSISGGHTITPAAGEGVTVNTGSGAQASAAQTTTISDSQPTQDESVSSNNVLILDGTRGNVYVYNGGVLNGNGTANLIEVNKGGIIAPGHSPGKLTVLNTLTLDGGATYQAQLKDANAGDFDQLVVGKAADTTGNDVTLGDVTNGLPTLDVSLYDGYKIKAGDQFRIIDNQSGTAVKGTFNNLPEGATFEVNGYTFKISYVAGDGNDVVLTAVSVPKTPNTGFSLVSAHPGATFGLTILAAGTIFAIARNNRKLAPAKARITQKRR